MKTRRTSSSWICARARAAAGRIALAGVAAAWLVSCSPPVEAPVGPAGDYASARTNLARGTSSAYDKALDTLEALGRANPPNAYSDRARVLRAVILAGRVEAHLKLSEAYAKGAEVTKNSMARSDDSRLRQDMLERGGELALDFGQLAMDLTKGGTLPKDLILDGPYPNPPPPVTIPALEKVKEGLPIGTEDQAQAALDAQHLAIADAMADVVHGDRDTARSKLNAGPVPLNHAVFALFMARELVAGASLYDKKHLNDPTRFRLIAGVADSAAQAAAAELKQNPDPDQAKSLKKLQDEIKAAKKT